VLVGGLVLVAGLTGPPGRSSDRPYDPSSTEPDGTRALVDVLRSLDTRVDVGDASPGPDTDATLVLRDGMNDARRRALVSWMKAGGTLVVADQDSELNPFRAASPSIVGNVDRDLTRHCSVPALSRVAHVRAPSAVLLRPRPPAVGCFTSGDDAWLVTERRGRGNLVVLGGPQAFTNGALDDADNGVLAVSLLAPRPGGRALVVGLPGPGRGRRTLVDLISPHVKLALLQLAVAFLLYALWRARRLGRPVSETVPVEIAGSELVAAVGRLMQRAGAGDHAAEVVRDGVRRSIAQRLGLSPAASVDEVSVAVADRTGRDAGAVRALLGSDGTIEERELVALTQNAEWLSREVSGGD
jgi:hypothetical protein